jgi:chemotaxis-related protein WspD
VKDRSAAAQLLDRDIPVDYLREWAGILAAEQRAVETKSESILVFKIRSEWCGLATTAVDEVTEVGVIRRLPHRAGSLVRGIVSLRGEVLVCVALDVLLSLEKQEKVHAQESRTTQSRLIICHSYTGRLAFVADEVHGVERYVPRDLRQTPATVSKSGNLYTAGILPWKDRDTIGCLDAERVFRSLDEGLS